MDLPLPPDANPASEPRPTGEAPPVITPEMLATSTTDSRQDFEKGMRLAPPVTLLLITANVVIFLVLVMKGALESREAIVLAGALSRERVLEGEVWRLVSAMFLHGGFDHLIGNCIALYVLGVACEHAFGTAKVGVLYLLAGLGGSLLSILWSMGPSVGASGAIFGLMGAGSVFFRKHGRKFVLRDNRVGVVLIVWALYSIVTGLTEPLIDNGAHIGGLLTGSAVALGFRPALLDRLPTSIAASK